jgi:MFS superfamily sulfate permease-like transporter
MQAQQSALEQRGITGAQAQQAMAFMAAIMTPVGIVVTSLITGVIVGFVVALIVSIFTQKGDPRAVI